MTHLLDAYKELLRSGNKELAYAMSDEMVYHDQPKSVVLAPVEVVPAVLPPLVTQYPVSIVPRPVFMPTAPFVGDDNGGGSNVNFSGGPVSVAFIPPVIGTMLVMIAGRVLVSLAVRGATDLYSHMKLKYHQRNVRLRVHTGIGQQNPGRKPPGDGYDPSIEGTPGDWSLETPPKNWPPEILGGPAFPFGLITYDWVNTYGPEFGSWL